MGDEDYMEVDLGQVRPKSEPSPLPSAELPPLVEKKWEIQYYLNYVDPEERIKIISVSVLGVPQEDLIKTLIMRDNIALEGNPRMIVITKVTELK